MVGPAGRPWAVRNRQARRANPAARCPFLRKPLSHQTRHSTRSPRSLPSFSFAPRLPPLAIDSTAARARRSTSAVRLARRRPLINTIPFSVKPRQPRPYRLLSPQSPTLAALPHPHIAGTMRQSWLLLALVGLVPLASALSIEEALHIDGIEAYLHNGVKRQAQGTGSSPTSSQPTSSSKSSSSTPDQKTSPTPTPTSPTDTSTTTPTQTPTTTTEPTTTTHTTSSSSSKITTPIVKTTPVTSTSIQQFTTVFTTVSDGQTFALTSTGESTSVFTSQSVQTELPTPQGKGSSSKGLSDSNKKIIGGVVGGVGGAILLGGIAIVCFRIWGKKKRVTEDDADLMAGTGSALGDKPQGGRSPFESNLEQYHNPGGRPNAAANF